MLLAEIVPNPDWNRLIPILGILSTVLIGFMTYLATRKGKPDTGEDTVKLEDKIANLVLKISSIEAQLFEFEKELKEGISPEKIHREINEIRVQAQEDRRQVFECFKQLIELSRKK